MTFPRTTLFVYLFLLPLAFSVYAFQPFEGPETWLTFSAVALLFPFIRFPEKWNLIDLAVTLSLGSAVLSTFTSNSPHMSILGDTHSPFGVLVVAAMTLIYFTVRQQFRTQPNRRALMQALVFGSIPVSIYALLQVSGHDPLHWPRQQVLISFGVLRPFSTIGHPNDLGGYLVMLYPFAVYLALGSALAITPLALMLPVIVFTQSRGVWIAFSASSAVMVLGSLNYRRRGQLALIAAPWVGIAVTAAVIVLYGRTNFSDAVRGRLEAIVRMGAAREFYWTAAWKIFKAHPWVGVGTDGFRMAFEHVRTPAYWKMEQGGTIPKAHNDFLNQLATQGMIGGAAFLFLFYAALRAAVKARRHFISFIDGDERLFILAVSASLVGYYVQNLSSFTTTTTGALFMTELGILSIGGRFADLKWLKTAWIVAAALAGLLFAYNYAFLPMHASSCASVGVKAAGESKHETAMHLLDYAGSIDPGNPEYPALLGMVAESINDMEMAGRAYYAASLIDPENALYRFRLALAIGSADQMTLAQSMEPGNPVFVSARVQ